MLAIQNGAVNWVHQDPVTKSQRVTNSSGAVLSTIDLDPWGGETNRSANSVFQPHKYTTYERDGNGGDDAMMRRYQSNWTRFSQPDPYDGSYDATDPQSFNRYSYVQNDPVNFTDPTGLFCIQREHWDEKTATLYVSWDCYLEGGGGGGGASIMPTGGGGSIEPRGGGGGGVGPQEPTVPLGDLRKGLQDLLKKGDCADYVQKLLNQVNKMFSGPYPHINTFWEGYDKISKAGKYQLNSVASNGGTVSGDLFANGALPGTVHINPFPTVQGTASAQARYAYKALHETFHLGKQGWYSDEQLARAAYAYAVKQAPNYGRDDTLKWSGRFDDFLSEHCPSKY
jgi:RHS repeat-associated protein